MLKNTTIAVVAIVAVIPIYATTVTWAIKRTQNHIGKTMGLFFSMDRMVGKDFELGLEKLKSIAEK